MEQRLAGEGLPRPVRILGINAAGQERDNALACEGRSLPWLQDTAAVDAWGRWRAAWRDVVVLDAENRVTAVYNLTDHDLAVAAHREHLEGLLRDAARR